MAKPIPIRAESSGATTETRLDLTVRYDTGINHYVVPNGFKVMVHEVTVEGEGESLFRLRCGDDADTFGNNPVWRSWKLANAGQMTFQYDKPLVFDAHEKEIYIFLSLNQPSAARASVSLNAEIAEVETHG